MVDLPTLVIEVIGLLAGFATLAGFLLTLRAVTAVRLTRFRLLGKLRLNGKVCGLPLREFYDGATRGQSRRWQSASKAFTVVCVIFLALLYSIQENFAWVDSYGIGVVFIVLFLGLFLTYMYALSTSQSADEASGRIRRFVESRTKTHRIAEEAVWIDAASDAQVPYQRAFFSVVAIWWVLAVGVWMITLAMLQPTPISTGTPYSPWILVGLATAAAIAASLAIGENLRGIEGGFYVAWAALHDVKPSVQVHYAGASTVISGSIERIWPDLTLNTGDGRLLDLDYGKIVLLDAS